MTLLNIFDSRRTNSGVTSELKAAESPPPEDQTLSRLALISLTQILSWLKKERAAVLVATVTLAVAFAIKAAPSSTAVKTLPVDSEKQAFVTDALLMMGLHNEVTVVIDPSATGCAYATTVEGAQYIGVDPSCVGPLRVGASYDWFVVGVLGHELGHLLNGQTTNGKLGSPPEEAVADEFSGHLMAQLGASLEEAKVFARRMDEAGGKTHPPRYARVTAVELGWTRGQSSNLPRGHDTNQVPRPSPEPEIAKQPDPLPPAPPVVTTAIPIPPGSSRQETALPPLVLSAVAALTLGLLALFVLNAWNAES